MCSVARKIPSPFVLSNAVHFTPVQILAEDQATNLEFSGKAKNGTAGHAGLGELQQHDAAVAANDPDLGANVPPGASAGYHLQVQPTAKLPPDGQQQEVRTHKQNMIPILQHMLFCDSHRFPFFVQYSSLGRMLEGRLSIRGRCRACSLVDRRPRKR